MSWVRVYGVRGLAAFVAGPVNQVSQPPVRLPRPAPVVRLPDLVGAPARVVADRVRRLVVMFCIDDSGSVQPPHGTDPHGARYAAARSVLDLMRRHGGGRAGVVHWGDTAPAELALAPVQVRRRGRQLERALAVRPQLGCTDPAVALARVRQLVPATSSDETLAVLLLTDGQDAGDSLAQELAALPAGSIHLVLVDPSGDCWGQEVAWRVLPWGSFTRLDRFDTPAVAFASGTALAHAIGLELAIDPIHTNK
jgi:hypothetical protein